MRGQLNVTFITMHGQLNVTFITIHGQLNIKSDDMKLYVREMGVEIFNWSQVAQDRFQWRYLEIMSLNLRFRKTAGIGWP